MQINEEIRKSIIYIREREREREREKEIVIPK